MWYLKKEEKVTLINTVRNKGKIEPNLVRYQTCPHVAPDPVLSQEDNLEVNQRLQ